MKAVKSVRSVHKDCSRGGINESLSVETGKENRLFTKKAQKYVQDSQMQMQYLSSRIQPAEKVDMNIIWDDDGKCALQISSEGEKNSFSLPDRISFASIMKGIRDSRGMSREEAYPFIRWDVVDMQRAFIEG